MRDQAAYGEPRQEGTRMDIRYPTDEDLARLTSDKVALLDRLLTVVEDEIAPLTRAGVAAGNKLFGGAVLKKSDLSTVVAVTNEETANPLNHGEIATINAFYVIPREQRPASKDTIFLSTHEPCSLCLSGITWGGWDNFFYLFSYEDSRDAANIPHDILINEEIFRVADGEYDHKNRYWSAWFIKALIESCEPADRERLSARVTALTTLYAEFSDTYQATKGEGAEIPLA